MSSLKDKRNAKARLTGHEKRKMRRSAERVANGIARSKGEEPPFPRKPLPPEPVVFAWFDWARPTGNVIHCGRRKFKYRLSATAAEIVAFSGDGRKLVKMPLRLALDVFGKA